MTGRSTVADEHCDLGVDEPTAELPVISAVPSRARRPATAQVHGRRQIAAVEAFGLLVAICVPVVLWHVAGRPGARQGALAITAAVALAHGRLRPKGLFDAFTIAQWALWVAFVASTPSALRRIVGRRSPLSRRGRSVEPLAPRQRLSASRSAALLTTGPRGHEPAGSPGERPSAVADSTLTVGSRGAGRVQVRLGELSGISIEGASATEVARMLVVRAISVVGARVVASDAVADRLFPGVAPGAVMRRVATPEALRGAIEVERIARARSIAHRLDTPDPRGGDTGVDVPLLVVAGSAPAHDRTRWSGAIGTDPWIVALFLEQTPLATGTLRVDRERVVVDATPAALSERLRGAVLDGMGEQEATAELGALGRVPDATTCVLGNDLASVAPARPATPRARRQPSTKATQDLPSTVVSPPIAVRVLGRFEISVFGAERTAGMRSRAKALLAYYVLYRDGARVERAVDALWPEVGADQVLRQFWRALGDLRSRLERVGAGHLEVLSKVGDHYRVNEAEVTCDLWDFECALERGARATEAEVAAAALRRAVDAYSGDLLSDWDPAWVETVREHLRRRALDACLRLGTLEEEAGRLDAAVVTLERALDVDPYAEAAYRQLMALHAARGRIDAIGATWQLLERRLRDLGAEPSPSTASHYQRLAHSR